MAKTRAQKEQTVTTYTDKLQRAKSVVLTDYQGLTMSQLSDLRNKLSDTDAEFTITKNTLLDLSLKQADLPETPAEAITGPTATLFSYGDEVSAIKVLVKALKDAQIGKIKGGFLGSQFFDSFTITKLSTLPGKQELRAQVVGTIAAPLSGMVNVLQANLRNFVYALDQIRQQRG